MRKKRPPRAPGPGNIGWVLSFADMVTILLAFLALILGITATDAQRSPLGFADGGPGPWAAEGLRRGDGAPGAVNQSLLAPVVELAENLAELPETLLLNQEEMKRAVFQLDQPTMPDFQRLEEAAREGIEFVKDSRGLVIKWDRALLFLEGEADLQAANVPLLEKLAVFLHSVNLPVSLESHTNPLSPQEGGDGPAAYELSMRRSKAVLEYLTGLGLAGDRFRLGGFGGSRPRTTDPEKAWENSRLEIIVYRPEQSSWRG